MKYIKPPFTFSNHVKLWESRGLKIDNSIKTEFYFNNISYYRLSAYALQYQNTKDIFNEGTNFTDILNLYKFDRELRLIALHAFEMIEVALRAHIVHILAQKYGSHWQDIPSLFKVENYIDSKGDTKTKDVYTDIQNIISNHCNSKYPEVFITHYKNKYHSPNNPPSWMIIELLTIGQLSRMYSALSSKDDKKEIARSFNLHFTIFENWIHTLTYGRNLCAHHSRFWNRDFVIQPTIPRSTLTLPWISDSITNNRRCFYFLSIVKYFLQTVSPNNNFKQKILDLMNKYPEVPIKYIGINTDNDGNLFDWQNEPLWKK